MKLLVIADDLSGATDVAAQFGSRGIRAIVLRHSHRDHAANAFHKHEVVLIDAETRHLSPSQAAERITRLTASARELGIKCFYKKTDSTLRGNVGAELEALLCASGQRTVCFVPAHPLLGRTTRGGTQYVHGTRLHESEFARDPRNPVSESDVAAILRRQTRVPISIVTQSEIPRFVTHLPEGISIFDAETVVELKRAAAAIKEAGCLSVLAGPAALASCLPDLLPFESSVFEPVKVQLPLLLVNGSLNQVALDQSAYAAAHGFARIELSAAILFSNTPNEPVLQTERLLRQGRNVLLSTVADRAELPTFENEAFSLGISQSDLAETVAQEAGRFVRAVLELRRKTDSDPMTLIVVGGDTLAGVAQANDWPGFVPESEILPGVALCKVPQLDEVLVITKPGGFGNVDFIRELAGSLQ